jgi:hypothetical protein
MPTDFTIVRLTTLRRPCVDRQHDDPGSARNGTCDRLRCQVVICVAPPATVWQIVIRNGRGSPPAMRRRTEQR